MHLAFERTMIHASCPSCPHVAAHYLWSRSALSQSHSFSYSGRRRSSRRAAPLPVCWLHDLDSAAVEGGLILTIGSTVVDVVRLRLLNGPFPRVQRTDAGKWAAVSVVGALPSLQWMAWPLLLASTPGLWSRESIMRYIAISSLYAGTVWFGSSDILGLLVLGVVCSVHLQVERVALTQRGLLAKASSMPALESSVSKNEGFQEDELVGERARQELAKMEVWDRRFALRQMTVAQLQDLARQAKVPNRSRLRKAALVAALEVSLGLREQDSRM